jgi:protein phosphatase methylesterase 1
MSNIQRDLFKNKILRKELEVKIASNDENEETDGLGSLGPPSKRFGAPKRRTRLQPKTWDEFFKQNFELEVTTRSGKGSFNVFYSPPINMRSPIFVFHHGAGSSGLSFALAGSKIQTTMERSQSDEVGGIISFDMRGHGSTVVEGEDDFSLDILTDDFLAVITGVFARENWQDEKPPLILVGHSLGAAVVTRAALQNKLSSLVGVVVIDAVEELAIEALQSMNRVVDKWPQQFSSLETAIDWQLSGNGIRNRESAVVSVPGIVKKEENGSAYIWRINLRRTEPFWKDWFTGLSKGFLSVPAARLLILAGHDRLDKDLMIGQMQGKYQLVVFSNCGHFVQEDEPDNTALTLIDFWTRNGRPQRIIPAFGKFR